MFWFMADLTYNPTSIMFINVPSISKLQWHPFTITSNSNLEPKMMSIVIKGEGTWSQKLYQMLSTPSAIDHLNVSVEGPYGPASTNYLRSASQKHKQFYKQFRPLTFSKCSNFLIITLLFYWLGMTLLWWLVEGVESPLLYPSSGSYCIWTQHSDIEPQKLS